MIYHQIILLFGLIAVGYVLNKIQLLPKEGNMYVSKLVVNFTLPCTIINAAIGQPADRFQTAVLVFLIAFGSYIVMPVFSWLFARMMHANRTMQLMLTYSNLGFMGLPLVASLYGDDMIFYVTIFMMAYNISMFSHGVYLLKKENLTAEDQGKINFKSFINPGTIGSTIAIIIFFFHIPVQSDVHNLISTIGSVTTPLAMISIGASLGPIPLKQVIMDRTLYFFAFLKLIVYPALAYGFCHFFIADPVIAGITVLMVALPTGGNVTMISNEYNGDAELSTKGICLSTLLFIVTVLFWIQLIQ